MKKTNLQVLSETIAKIMDNKDITPKELSLKSKIGYSTLIPILKGTRDCGFTKLIAIANALECDPNTLLNGLIRIQPNKKNNNKQVSSEIPPKYLVSFISLASETHCLILEIDSHTQKALVFPFALGCGQNPDDFIDYISLAIKESLQKNFIWPVNFKDIAIFVSIQQYEGHANRAKIQNYADSLFAKFIIESDAITNYHALVGKNNAICITINDGNGIAYSFDKGKNVTKVHGYGFPISDVAGHHWIGCEAIKHVIKVKEGIGPSTSLSDGILALFNYDVY
jgi:hypothetical protein